MTISEIQSEIGHCSCDSAKFKAPAILSHHAILFMTLSLRERKIDTAIMLNWISAACVAQWVEHMNIAHLYF